MKKYKWLFSITCYLAIMLVFCGCGEQTTVNPDMTDAETSKVMAEETEMDGKTTANPISYLNGMTDTEKSKVMVEETELGEHITLFDEEIKDSYEIILLKSSAYDASKEASFYLVQGNIFNDTQLAALREFLNTNAPQTLLAVMNVSDDKEAETAAIRDFVEDAQAYKNFLVNNLMGWICDNYKVKDICFAGYENAGYFAAYLLHTGNSVDNYIIINPELQKTTDDLEIAAREEAFFTEGNTSLPANVCLLRSEDDKNAYAYTITDQWINTLAEHAYEGLIIHDEVLAGAGHNVIDCEALLRGISYFNQKEYGDNEAACVLASKAMTRTESESITVGKLSNEHEFYNEVIGIDSECAEYINEIVMYDEEINDNFVVHVSLPPNYDETKSYPLVLMTDGIWRLSDHPELRQLMTSGEVEDVILASVGYPNGYDYLKIRERDLLRQPDLYLQFLVENLMPYLCENYCVDAARTTLAGHSYGGYWGIYALFHSDTIGKESFAYYYIGSPSFQAYTNKAYANDFEDWFYERKQTLDCSVYITVGGDEETAFIDFIERNLDDIKKHTYEGLALQYEVIDGYDHNTVFKPSIKNTLIKFYGIH